MAQLYGIFIYFFVHWPAYNLSTHWQPFSCSTSNFLWISASSCHLCWARNLKFDQLWNIFGDCIPTPATDQGEIWHTCGLLFHAKFYISTRLGIWSSVMKLSVSLKQAAFITCLVCVAVKEHSYYAPICADSHVLCNWTHSMIMFCSHYARSNERQCIQ